MRHPFRIAVILILSSLFYSLVAQNSMNVIAQFQGEHHNSAYGTRMVSIDFNHDSYTDLVVLSSIYGYQYETTPGRGKVYIYYGGPNFSSTTPASVTLEGNFDGTSGRRIGNIYNFGDVNGDGFDDLCIMDLTPLHEGDYRYMFYYFPVDTLANPDYILSFPDGIDNLVLRKAGDVNGDGSDDIGITHQSTTSTTYIFSIFTGGDFSEHIVTTFSLSHLSLISTVVGVGDINNDGFADFTVGYTNEDPDTGYHLIQLYYGNADLVFTNATTIVQTQEPVTISSVSLGDMNGDGYADFLGYVSNQGMQAWFGGDTLNFAAPDISFHPIWYSTDGGKQTTYGDVNNDGYDDMVSTNYYGNRMGLWLGREQPNGVADWTTYIDYDNFGMGLSMGDYNADGFCDIAVAAPIEDNAPIQGDFYGFLWVYGGNAVLDDTTATEDAVLPVTGDNIKLSLSPNPIGRNQQLKIRVSNIKGKSPITTEIFNIKGQRLFQQTSAYNTIDRQGIMVKVSDWSTGLYLCRASQGTKQQVKKFNLIK